MVSHDGGSTWAPCGQVLEPGSDAMAHFSPTGATENSEVIGRPAIARDGTMYVPFTLPRNQGQLVTGSAGASDITESALFVAVSPPGGCTPTTVFHDITIHDEPGSDLVSIFPNAAVDGGGMVYISGAGRLNDQQKQQGVYLWSSVDGGKTFSKPQRVNTPDIGAAQLQAVAGGRDRGEVLLGWYGATNITDSNDTKGVWRYYMAQSFDGGRTFEQSTVTPQPFHYGNICNKGIICGSNDNRNLLDFTSVDVDPATGCSYAVFAGDPYNPAGATSLKKPAAYVARQSDGACLQKGVGMAQSAAQPVAAGCRDRIAPQSTFSRRIRRVHGGRVRLSGRARDRGCGRLGAGRVARERVSIARATGKRCRFLAPNRRFSAPRSCLRTSYLSARGTTRWSFVVPRRLPKGRYKLWARGIDSAGNVERKLNRRNLGRLTVR
ncbi:MAG: sialidase family protein [Solirubrobacteraceae bacterium]